MAEGKKKHQAASKLQKGCATRKVTFLIKEAILMYIVVAGTPCHLMLRSLKVNSTSKIRNLCLFFFGFFLALSSQGLLMTRSKSVKNTDIGYCSCLRALAAAAVMISLTQTSCSVSEMLIGLRTHIGASS